MELLIHNQLFDRGIYSPFNISTTKYETAKKTDINTDFIP